MGPPAGSGALSLQELSQFGGRLLALGLDYSPAAALAAQLEPAEEGADLIKLIDILNLRASGAQN